MNEEQIKAIEERANAATPGEWEPRGDIVKDIAFEDDVIFYAADSMGPHIESGDWQTAVSQMRADSAFIAHARADVPALIAEIRSLRAKLDAVPVAELRFWWDPFKGELTNDVIEKAAVTIETWLKAQEVQP